MTAALQSFQWIGEFCEYYSESQPLIRGYLETDSLNAYIGDSSSGKSFLAIDQACHIAHGMKWRGKRTKKGIVLYICGEGKKGIQKRFKAWHEYHKLPMQGIAIRKTSVALCEKDSVDFLLSEITRFLSELNEKPVMVVVDTLNRNFGNGDENNTKDMTAFIAGMDSVRQETGAAILVIHHCGHSAKDRARGSIALHNAIDASYLITKEGEDLCSWITTMNCNKIRDSEEPPNLSWSWELQSLPWLELDDDDNPVPLSSVVFLPCDPMETASGRGGPKQLSALQRKALDALRELHRQHGETLAAGGCDPAGARVSMDDWCKATESLSTSKSVRSRTRKELIELSIVELNDPFVTIKDG